MSGFTFAGEHSTIHHVRLLKSPISVLPSTRDKVITLPGRHGALRMLPDFGERNLQLECWLAATTIPELHSRLEQVRSWLNPLRGTHQLIFDRTPNRHYLATLVGELGMEITVRQGLFTVNFVCADPFAYSDIHETNRIITNFPGEIEVTSLGNLATHPTITVINQGTQIMNGYTISYFKEV